MIGWQKKFILKEIKDERKRETIPSLWRIFLSLFSNPPMATPGQIV